MDELDRVTFVDFPDASLDTTYTYGTNPAAFDVGRLTGITRDGHTVGYAYAKVPTGGGRGGHTPCDKKPGVIEVSRTFCGFGMATRLAKVMLHELGHYADCDQQKFPPGGEIEEGCLAEIWCFGSVQDSRSKCRTLERAMRSVLD